MTKHSILWLAIVRIMIFRWGNVSEDLLSLTLRFLSALGLCSISTFPCLCLNHFSSVPHPLFPQLSYLCGFPFFCHLQSRQLRIQIPSALLSPRTFKKWWICAPASCPYSWKNSKGRRWLNFRLLPLIWNISVSLKMIKVLLHLQHVSVLECTHKLSNMVFLYFWKQPYQLFWVLAKTLLSSIC